MRVAVVGTGGVAQRHLGVLAGQPDIQLVGHVSLDLARSEAQAARWGGRGYMQLADALHAEHPNAVWICVTPDRHGPLEFTLIERGVAFFVEKPLGADLATAEAIATRLERTPSLVTAVGYKFRALDTLPRVRQLLAETPPRMVLAAWHDALPPPAWWRRADQSGGQVVEQATHLLDLARVLVGEASVLGGFGGQWPRADAPDSDVPDVSAAVLRFTTADGPLPGVLTATCLLRGRQSIHLQLVCEGRVLTVSERALLVDSGQHTEEILTSADPFQVEDEAFIRAVRSGDPTQVMCSYAYGLTSHRGCQVREALSAPQ